MDRLGRETWVRLLEELRASGVTQREFAEERGLSVSTLQFWIRKLRRERSTPRFLPVRVVASAAPSARPANTSGVEVLTANGHLVRFPREADPKFIGAVLAELG